MLFRTWFELSARLRGPHPLAKTLVSNYDEATLDKVSYEDIDMLQGIPREPTQSGYAVIGGSGFVGTYIVRMLLLRGEKNIRILDLVPPSAEISKSPSVTYVKMDMTSPESVREGLFAPFPALNAPPAVIFHTAASIRIWERARYTWDASYNINVRGTQNILQAAKALHRETLFIYTSTSDLVLPSPRFMQLGKDHGTSPWNKIVFSDDDPPLTALAVPKSSYARSKAVAEQLVLEGDRVGGLVTASLRPGQTITGPNDRFYTSTLTMPRVPIFDRLWSHTNVCVWDVAAAHLALEGALHRNAAEIGGQAFLITGNGPAWSMQESRAALKHFSKRPLVFDDIPPLLIFILAHIVEALLFLRFYFLLPFFAVVGKRPSISPSWLGELVYLQPATLDYIRDVVIDDSRARKMIGYKPQWQTAQVIKYTVDQLESGKVATKSGMSLERS